jgi:hypothetical protein
MKPGRPRKSGGPAATKNAHTAGITKRQSAEWQKLAQIPDAEFEAMLKRQAKLSTGSLVREGHGLRARRIASLERMAAELRVVGWTVFPPTLDDAGAP